MNKEPRDSIFFGRILLFLIVWGCIFAAFADDSKARYYTEGGELVAVPEGFKLVLVPEDAPPFCVAIEAVELVEVEKAQCASDDLVPSPGLPDC
jgi:hypothetical protein